jgi:hypothetical protein
MSAWRSSRCAGAGSTSDVGDGRVQWYSFLAQPPGTKRADDSWEGGASTDAQGADVIAYLKGLHEGWTDEIHYVLDSTPAANVEQRDLYDRWPEFFRSWADESVVLLGDAVHPMMPNLGQGGCQAIEDAYELTRALEAVVEAAGGTPEPTAVRAALQGFYEKRVGRVAGVSLLSRLASDLIINFFDTPWSPHDERGQSPLSYLTFAWKPLLQFFVFPLQFLFLYSYHPTGPMGELPKQARADVSPARRANAPSRNPRTRFKSRFRSSRPPGGSAIASLRPRPSRRRRRPTGNESPLPPSSPQRAARVEATPLHLPRVPRSPTTSGS